MRESRMFHRVTKANMTCFVNGNDKTRKVFNISAGGMLIERFEEDELEIGKNIPIQVIFDDQTPFSVEGKIIRKQEPSLAIQFSNVSKDLQKELKKI